MTPYVGAEGRRQRKELISQLRSAVPTAWTYCIADVLLDRACLDPPVPSASGKAQSAASGGKADRVEEQAWASGELDPARGSFCCILLFQTEDAIAESAHNLPPHAAMRLLVKAYPTLQPLLLIGSVRRICALALAAGSRGSGRAEELFDQQASPMAPADPHNSNSGSDETSRSREWSRFQELCAWATRLLPSSSV